MSASLTRTHLLFAGNDTVPIPMWRGIATRFISGAVLVHCLKKSTIIFIGPIYRTVQYRTDWHYDGMHVDKLASELL